MKIIKIAEIKRIKKSVKILIITLSIFLITIISFDNIYFFSNRKKVEDNRKKLTYNQVMFLESISTSLKIELTDEQLNQAFCSNDTIIKKGE